MIELGDLRKGILPSDVEPMVAEVMGLRGVKLIGFGTNLSCFGGVRPTETKMRELSGIAGNLQRQYGITFEIVSRGNSINYQWFVSTPDVGLVNHLRIGEVILLGCDTLTRERILSLYTDAFTLVAEVVELKTKPSRPYGEITQDAFGHVPVFEGKGNMERAILALGRQDVDGSAIKPRIKADVLGASSDHLILDVSGLGLEVGAKVRYDVGYSALLRAMTSPYVKKVYLPQSHLMARGVFLVLTIYSPVQRPLTSSSKASAPHRLTCLSVLTASCLPSTCHTTTNSFRPMTTMASFGFFLRIRRSCFPSQ